jgi:hypothetical protein
MAMKVDGACHCGAIAFEAEVDADTVRICHCTDCQNAGGLFRLNIVAAGETFRLLRGTPKSYIKTAESGNKRAQVFCAECGTGLWSRAPDGTGPLVLRVGPIAQRGSFRPRTQIWCRSELPWTKDVGAADRFERQGS